MQTFYLKPNWLALGYPIWLEIENVTFRAQYEVSEDLFAFISNVKPGELYSVNRKSTAFEHDVP